MTAAQPLLPFPADNGERHKAMQAGRRRGRLLRDAGIQIASRGRRARLDLARRDLLALLLSRPDSTGTIDDIATDLGPHGDGGRWCGAIPGPLVRSGIIERSGDAQSCRPSRHAGRVSRWRLRDREAAAIELKRLDLVIAQRDAQRDSGPHLETGAGI